MSDGMFGPVNRVPQDVHITHADGVDVSGFFPDEGGRAVLLRLRAQPGGEELGVVLSTPAEVEDLVRVLRACQASAWPAGAA